MRYTLYITDHCTSCNRVLQFMQASRVSFDAVNLDDPGQNWPEKIMIVPALTGRDQRLLAVGPDIQDYIQRRLIKISS